MRVAYIHQYYVTPDDPGGTRSYELARRLVAHGHEVHVVTTDTRAARPGLSWRHTLESGVHVHRLPVPYRNAMSYQRRIWSFMQFAVAGAALATRLKPDVVLATSTPLTVAFPGVLASRLRRARFVFEVRDLWPELPIEIGALRNPVAQRLAFALAHLAYRNAAHVIALSPGMADGVAAQGVPIEKISVVPNGCDTDVFAVPETEGDRFRSARPWLGERPLITYAGTFGVVNGIHYLVHVAARMLERDPEVRFLLVGDGRTFDDVRDLAARLGVLDRNLFVSSGVPKSAMPQVLSASTVVTSVFLPLAGMRNNSANKFFDGLAAGRPIAINYGGWHADLVTTSGAGIVLDPSDADASARLLASVVRDGEWLARARTAARSLAETMFSRDDLYAHFESALTGATPTRRGPADSDGTGPSLAPETSAGEAFRGTA
jgi:glycosyltransferase involved in cell wall biosynthesis